jgi:hypothetical protein
MIQMMFSRQGKHFGFTINNKNMIGTINGVSLPYYPSNITYVRRAIILSRNKIPAWMIELFNLKEEDLKEIENAKDDNELKDIVIKECKKNQCELDWINKNEHT